MDDFSVYVKETCFFFISTLEKKFLIAFPRYLYLYYSSLKTHFGKSRLMTVPSPNGTSAKRLPEIIPRQATENFSNFVRRAC